MATEDVIGEGTRLENAQKAAAVWANLAQAGDRYGVMGFNAKNNLVSCGLPGGDGDCELDIRTHLARTDITNPAAQISTSASPGSRLRRCWHRLPPIPAACSATSPPRLAAA